MRSESLVTDAGVQEPEDPGAISPAAAATLLRAHHVQLGPLFLSATSCHSACPGLLHTCKLHFRLQKEDAREARSTRFWIVCLSA